MAKLKLTFKNFLVLVFAFFGNTISAQADQTTEEETPKAGGEEAAKEASGSLSAGAIAAAVAAAAAIAAAIDSGDGGGAAPAPTPAPTAAPTPAPTAAPAPTPAPTETYTYYIPNQVNVNTTTATETTTSTLTNEFRPGVNTSTNTNTTTNTLTLYNQLVSTNTSTSTSTNTATNTSTNTQTTTQTYVDSDGEYEYDTTNDLGDYVQTITLGGGIYSDQDDGTVNGVNNNVGQDIPQLELEYNILYDGVNIGDTGSQPATPGGLQIEIEQTWDLDLDRVYGAGGLDDPYANGIGSDDTSGQGSKELNNYEMIQYDLDIVQDITVEVERIQDFTQVQEIEQSISQPIAATGTRLKSN